MEPAAGQAPDELHGGEDRSLPFKLASTSLALAVLGWAIYLLNWCLDLTLGVVLASATAGVSAICGTALDILPFLVWVLGIVSGHASLARLRRMGGPGRKRAVWGLALSYVGIFLAIVFNILIIFGVVAGIHALWVDQIAPLLHR